MKNKLLSSHDGTMIPVAKIGKKIIICKRVHKKSVGADVAPTLVRYARLDVTIPNRHGQDHQDRQVLHGRQVRQVRDRHGHRVQVYVPSHHHHRQ